MAEINILNAEQLADASRRADFSRGGESFARTMQMRPGDYFKQGKGHRDFFEAADAAGLAFPTLHWKGAKRVRAVRESQRPRHPESRWVDHDEPVELAVHGVVADGCLVLRFVDGEAIARTFGLPAGHSILVSGEDLPWSVCSALGATNPVELFARIQAQELRASTPDAPHGEDALRI